MLKKKLNIIKTENLEKSAERAYQLIKGKNIAISGGSTYNNICSIWTEKFDFNGKIFFPVDERKVPIDDPYSNWGTLNELFFKKIGDTNSPTNFATDKDNYSKILSEKINKGIPIFDTILLGAGDDGHTASLFPKGEYLHEMKQSVIETSSPKPPIKRITITPAVIKAAKNIILIIVGKSKKPILDRILNQDESLPIVQMLMLRETSYLITDVVHRA